MGYGNLPPLALLPAFEAAGRLGSFKAAALALHVTPSAVSQQIKALEQALGLALFERGPRAVALTAEGREYHHDVQLLLGDMQAATRRLQRRRIEPGVLRISTTHFVATEFIIPKLTHFRARFPGLDLRVESSTQMVSLPTDDFDAALRIATEVADGTRSQRCGTLVAAVVCAPQLAAGIETLEDALEHPLIEMRGFEDRGWHTLAKSVRPGQILMFDTYFETVRAAEQGLGVAFAIFPLTTAWVKSGRLAVPLARRTEMAGSLQWVCGGADHRPVLDEVGEWMAEQYADLPDLPCGRSQGERWLMG